MYHLNEVNILSFPFSVQIMGTVQNCRDPVALLLLLSIHLLSLHLKKHLNKLQWHVNIKVLIIMYLLLFPSCRTTVVMC